MKLLTSVVCMLTLAGMATATLAEPVQDCILEGLVKQSENSQGVQSVYIDFHSVSRYSTDKRCNLRKSEVEFDGITGSQIGTVTPGSTVKYRYTENNDNSSNWQLVEVQI